MTFKHLEDELTSEGNEVNLEKYMQVFSELSEPTKTVLGYTLDFAAYLNELRLGNQFCLHGGYGVLSHLMLDYGEDITRYWRGSEDIDCIGTFVVLSALKSGYNVKGDRPSQNIDGKRTVKLDNGSEQECKIDYTLESEFLDLGVPERNRNFGIDLLVLSPLNLIRGKLNTPVEQIIHSYDIMSMLALLEKRGYDSLRISGFFDERQKALLLERIVLIESSEMSNRLGISPSDKFLREVKTCLKSVNH